MGIKVPKDFAVQPIEPTGASGEATCGDCGLTWDDTQSTQWTPVPSGRCPFEYFHEEEVPEQLKGTCADPNHRGLCPVCQEVSEAFDEAIESQQGTPQQVALRQGIGEVKPIGWTLVFIGVTSLVAAFVEAVRGRDDDTVFGVLGIVSNMAGFGLLAIHRALAPVQGESEGGE